MRLLAGLAVFCAFALLVLALVAGGTRGGDE